MLPILINLGFLKIYTQGVFMVLAFFWGLFFLWKNVLLTSYKEEDVFDSFFISLFGGLFLGRLVHVILHFADFGYSIPKFVLINGYPGINVIGAIIGGLVTLYIYLLSKKIDFIKVIDYVISPLFLAMAIGKLGSFFSGTEIGTKTNFLIALKYPNIDGARHITAFYEALLFFIGSFIAYKLMFAIRRGTHSVGTGFAFFAWYFSLVYVLFDFLKSDRVMVFGISFDMIIAGIILLTASIYFVYYFRAAIISKVAFIKR